MAAPMARSITLQAQQQEDINDTPLLWMRVDPHFLWLRRIVMELPTENSLGQIMLRDQLRWRGGEKGGSCANCDAITAQRARRGSAGGFAMWSAKLEALDALAALPRPGSDGISGGAGGALNAIKECACDVSEDIRVRVAAVQALATWQNNHAPRSSTDGDDERSPHTSWAGSTALRSFFKSEWFVDGDKDTPLANAALFARDASQLSHVELKKATACAIGRVRAGDGYALVEDARFLLNVLKNNDNTGSAKRDDYLHAALIDAVASAAAHLRSRRAARRGRAESCASCSDSEEESGAGSAVALRARVRDAGDERESERCEATLNEVVQVLRTKLHFDQVRVAVVSILLFDVFFCLLIDSFVCSSILLLLSLTHTQSLALTRARVGPNRSKSAGRTKASLARRAFAAWRSWRRTIRVCREARLCVKWPRWLRCSAPTRRSHAPRRPLRTNALQRCPCG
jgi:hypothetical protein